MIKWWLQPLWLKHLPKGHFLIHLLLFSCWVMSNSCDPMTCSTPGFPIFHYLPEFAQTHIHWVIDAIQPSQTPFSSCSQSFPAIGSFPMTQVFASGGQSIGASVSAIVFPRNIQSWFPLGLTGLISLLSKGLSRVFSSTQFKSINSSVLSLLYGPTLTSMGFPNSPVGDESSCNARDLGSIPGLGRSLGEGWLPSPVFWPGEFHQLYSPWGRKESDITERLSISHPYMTPGKTIALTWRTFVGKVLSLLSNTLSRFVITFPLHRALEFQHTFRPQQRVKGTAV